jgi:hypothetical protein
MLALMFAISVGPYLSYFPKGEMAKQSLQNKDCSAELVIGMRDFARSR